MEVYVNRTSCKCSIFKNDILDCISRDVICFFREADVFKKGKPFLLTRTILRNHLALTSWLDSIFFQYFAHLLQNGGSFRSRVYF